MPGPAGKTTNFGVFIDASSDSAAAGDGLLGFGPECPPQARMITPNTASTPAPPTQLATILNVESAAAFAGIFSVDGHSTGGFAAAADGATDTGPTICIFPSSAIIWIGAALAVSRMQKSVSAISAT